MSRSGRREGGLLDLAIEILRSPTGVNTDWFADAVCAQTDPSLFFPEPGRGAQQNSASARLICRGCPVAAQCDQWATASGERFGIWAGAQRDVDDADELREVS